MDLNDAAVTKVNLIIDKMRRENDIDSDTALYLRPEATKTSRFYTLPKTHKTLNNRGQPKIRPVISGNGSPIERLSEFVDSFLNPLMRKLPSYLKDSRDLIKIINQVNTNGPLAPNIGLFTIDVVGMYPSIPEHLGLSSARKALNSRVCVKPSTDNLIECLKICLNDNHFEFNSEFFTQIRGTAIGPKMAPGYACLAMGTVEEKLFSITSHLPEKWYRYIDDIWGLWPHGEANFAKFMDTLNNLYPEHLKFTSEFSQKEVNYLDISIEINTEGYLKTNLYTKPSQNHLYLHYSSYHRNMTKDNIIYGETIRTQCVTSDPQDLESNLGKLKIKFKRRGYPTQIIEQKISEAQQKSRSDILLGPPNKKSTVIQAPCVVTRNPKNPNLEKIIQKNFHILQLSPKFKQKMPQPPKVIYRQPPNLRSLLVKAKIPTPTITISGCFKTHTRNCVTCAVLKETKTFRSKQGENFVIKEDITCTTKGVIYLIDCRDCGKQYVGETGGELRIRHRGHRQELRNNNTPLGKHFNTCKNFHLIGIENVRNNTKSIREQRELNWIYRLKTLQPEGINHREASTHIDYQAFQRR